MRRTCSRPGCAAEATATFAFVYATSTVTLGPLSAEPHPVTYDLCSAHANRLTPPRGWALDDQRRPAAPNPAGFDGRPQSAPIQRF